MSFTGVGNQLKTLSGKLQAAAVAAAHVGAESTGVELATFLPLSGAHGTAAGTTGAGTSGGDGVDTDASSGAGAGSGGAMLQVDPDLEEYLRGAAGSDVDEVGSEEAVARVLGDGGEGEELDLDKYLKELSAEVADGEGGEGEGEGDSTDGVDVDAVLREMDLGDVDGGDDDDDEVNKIVAQAQDAAKLNVD